NCWQSLGTFFSGFGGYFGSFDRFFHQDSLPKHNYPLKYSSTSDNSGNPYEMAIIRSFFFLIIGGLFSTFLALWGIFYFDDNRRFVRAVFIFTGFIIYLFSLLQWCLPT